MQRKEFVKYQMDVRAIVVKVKSLSLDIYF